MRRNRQLIPNSNFSNRKNLPKGKKKFLKILPKITQTGKIFPIELVAGTDWEELFQDIYLNFKSAPRKHTCITDPVGSSTHWKKTDKNASPVKKIP